MICLTANISTSAYTWVAVIAIISLCLLAFVIFECIRLNVNFSLKTKELESKVEEANILRDEAVRKSIEAAETLKSISREVLSPINAARTVIPLIPTDNLTDEVKDYIDVLKRSSNSLAQIAEDVLGVKPLPEKEHTELSEDEKEKTDKKFFIPDARILVVDDNKVNLKVASALLNSYKCEVVAVDNAYEAIDRFRSGEEFDLVFMDHLMPGMDGIEAAKHIHNILGEGNKVPIIAITANTGSDLELSFFNAGMCDFLPKPIVSSQLKELLIKWIPAEKQIYGHSGYDHEEVEACNLEALLKDYWEDSEIFNQLLRQFLEEGDALIPLLESGADRDELANRLICFSRYAHSLNANTLKEKAEDLTEALNSPDKDFYTSFLRPFKEDYNRVSETLRKYLNSSLTTE